MLALVDDTWSNENYLLFKIKINKVVAGEDVSLSYQRIAEAPRSDFRNFYCSKHAEVKNAASRTEGEVTIYGRSYGGYDSSTFGFDYGLNGFDGKFVRAERVMSFGDGRKCSSTSEEVCVTPYVGWVKLNWKRVAIEKSSRFVTYTNVDIPLSEASDETTLTNE